MELRLSSESGCRKSNEDTFREVRFALKWIDHSLPFVALIEFHFPEYWTKQTGLLIPLSCYWCQYPGRPRWLCLGHTEIRRLWGWRTTRSEASQSKTDKNRAVSTVSELKRRWMRVGEPKQRRSDSLISSRAPQTWTGPIWAELCPQTQRTARLKINWERLQGQPHIWTGGLILDLCCCCE